MSLQYHADLVHALVWLEVVSIMLKLVIWIHEHKMYFAIVKLVTLENDVIDALKIIGVIQIFLVESVDHVNVIITLIFLNLEIAIKEQENV